MGSLVSLEVALPVANNAELARALVVTNRGEFEFAAGYLRGIKDTYAEIEAERVKLKKPIDEAAKAVQALFKPILDDLTQAEQIVKGTMLTFQQEEERAEAARVAAAEVVAAAERARLEEGAAVALESGDFARAEVLSSTAEVIQSTAVAKQVVAAGIITRKVWRSELIDTVEFLKAALVRQELLAAVAVDLGRINKMLAATDGAMKIPGIRVKQEAALASRRAA